MLPGDVKLRKQVASTEKLKQKQLDEHLKEVPRKEHIAAYSHQPIQALEHPAFKTMIDIASRAREAVSIPSQKVAMQEIIRMFNEYMVDLKARFAADNVDGYFAVTAHWIEAVTEDQWELKNAIIGFTYLNNAHNGKRLGQVLFKIVDRLGIADCIGHVTCDNAKNNGTMLAESAAQVQARMGKIFNPKKSQINCLGHVINLATQAVLNTYSKTPHFDPANPENHIPETAGLIRAICVKERSSAKRKETYHTIQVREGIDKPRQLLLDMKFIATFAYKIALQEKDITKRRKLDALTLSADEWERVELFIQLLAHADDKQQCFSSESQPCLQYAIPALEGLHKAWSAHVERVKYAHFADTLQAGIDKIAEYYDKTGDSDAYIICIYLAPEIKGSHFKKHWSLELQQEAKELIKRVFREHYSVLSKDSQVPEQTQKLSTGKARMRLRALSDDELETEVIATAPSRSMGKPWLPEFRHYLNMAEHVQGDMSAVKWWGLNAHRYPVWASLARDYLSIMATSVSSERAFSQGGITVSKRRNRLKGDVVEALQCLKCAIRQDLLFAPADPSSALELSGKNDDGLESDGSAIENIAEQSSWDIMLDNDEDMYDTTVDDI
ncbi:hypothetical protein PHLCEN_2v1847 [Hermanssonia centrifuga]|uniref:HAT C-terminal dimerisation domain-containing protein n=1 Tax=Hermanssonia centrifuga TaxID=98765 RepID=A0A2R6RVS0_9APHY|nr:hypothetical protein PHLCEN_2v8525 [Hermanssonia centrifuga]PSS34106.1 hypothetical protein PHLCEN_2v1847 [Hermanssonia centrifuga]